MVAAMVTARAKIATMVEARAVTTVRTTIWSAHHQMIRVCDDVR